jgi:hypothetical protein
MPKIIIPRNRTPRTFCGLHARKEWPKDVSQAKGTIFFLLLREENDMAKIQKK